MSGHSKWSQIKRQKAVTDNKRGALFTKLGNAIVITVKHGGKDSSSNFRLRVAIDSAKSANMPNDNIERAIKRGAGEIDGVLIEEIIYEGYGPGGTAIIIEVATDNKNRSSANIRKILTKYGGNLGSTGNVMWMFQKKGVIRIPNEEIKNQDELELQLIDAGSDDIISEAEGITILSKPEQLPAINKTLETLSVTPASAEIEYVSENKVSELDEKTKNKLTKLFEELEEDDDVSNYYTNAEL